MFNRLLVGLLVSGAALAQSPVGTVDVTATIIATAGTLKCVGNPLSGGSPGTSTMNWKCVDTDSVTSETLFDYALKVTVSGATEFTIKRGGNIITLLLVKGAPTPDRWEVSANGVMKTGSF